MKIDRECLVNTLERVIPALGSNALVPEYGYLQIDGQRIQATDGTMLIDTTSPEDTGLQCAVIGKSFLSLLKSLDKEKVELIHKEGNVKVKTNKIEGTFAALDEVTMKNVDFTSVSCEVMPPKILPDLVKGINFCRWGVSKDETSGPLCGVRITKNLVLSTDRYRISKYELDGHLPFDCSLPSKFIDILLRNKDEVSEVKYTDGGKFVVCLQDGTKIVTCVLSGEYPDLLQYFPSSANEEIKFMGGQANAIERHINFLKNVDYLDKKTGLRIQGSKCVITSKAEELGELVEELEVSIERDSVDIAFSVNPIFLRNIIFLMCSGFKYYFQEGLVLFEADKLQYLIQTRG
jgi:DNA polymerase III sliding clamp (beta) subunit (PCNA family)